MYIYISIYLSTYLSIYLSFFSIYSYRYSIDIDTGIDIDKTISVSLSLSVSLHRHPMCIYIYINYIQFQDNKWQYSTTSPGPPSSRCCSASAVKLASCTWTVGVGAGFQGDRTDSTMAKIGWIMANIHGWFNRKDYY